ncbi:MAG: TetR/AcrR family transcriptional regulator [Acidimicrobiia bacterium]
MARPTAVDHDDKAAAMLAAAGRVFAERGVEGATMADVAREAGFSKAGLYHYFDSKDHLLRSLLVDSLTGLLGDLDRADPGPGEKADARMAALIEAYVRSFTSRIRVIAPLLFSVPAGGRLAGTHRPDWGDDIKRLERQVVDRFEAAAGGLSSPLPARTNAFLVLGAANWTYHWYDPSGDVPVDELARGVAALFTG